MPLQRLLPGLFEFGDAARRPSARRRAAAVAYDQRQLFRRLYRADQAHRNPVVAHQSFEGLLLWRSHFADEPRIRFGEQPCDGLQRLSQLVEIMGDGADIDMRAPAAGKRHFGDGHGQATFAQVVAASHQTRADGLMQRLETCVWRAAGRPGARCHPDWPWSWA